VAVSRKAENFYLQARFFGKETGSEPFWAQVFEFAGRQLKFLNG